ncbi:peroxiredoxin [bacterium]|nr:peroxiredoxin [bacterium]
MGEFFINRGTLVGQAAPDFKAKAYCRSWGGFQDISLSDYRGKWLVLYYYPLDFTFVCPTEITAFNDRLDEFKARDAEVLGVSIDSHHCHRAWVERGDLGDLQYPLLGDITKEISRAYGVLDEEAGFTFRATFIIDPEGKVRFAQIHDNSIGRSIDELLRNIDALQSGGLCPANWKKGEVLVASR